MERGSKEGDSRDGGEMEERESREGEGEERGKHGKQLLSICLSRNLGVLSFPEPPRQSGKSVLVKQ